jgi:hypothetical protein
MHRSGALSNAPSLAKNMGMAAEKRSQRVHRMEKGKHQLLLPKQPHHDCILVSSNSNHLGCTSSKNCRYILQKKSPCTHKHAYHANMIKRLKDILWFEKP